MEPTLMKVALHNAVLQRYGDGSQRWDALADELIGTFGEHYASRIAESAHKNVKRWSRDACGRGVKQMPTERYAILISHLFGTLHALKHAIHQFCVTCEKDQGVDTICPEPPAPCFSDIELRELLHHHQGCIRTMARETGLSKRFLLRARSRLQPDLMAAKLRCAQREHAATIQCMYAHGVTLKDIMRQTGVGVSIVIKIVDTLPDLKVQREQALFIWRRDRCRALFMEQVVRGASRSLIRIRLPGALNWMLKHDAVWVRARLPSVRLFRGKRNKPRPAFDWSWRDATWAAHIPSVVQTLIDEQCYRTVRIRPYTILRKMGWQRKLHANAEQRLPKTFLALGTCSESARAYRCRRFAWAVKQFSQAGYAPRKRAICRLAGIAHRDFENYLWLVGFDLAKVSKF